MPPLSQQAGASPPSLPAKAAGLLILSQPPTVEGLDSGSESELDLEPVLSATELALDFHSELDSELVPSALDSALVPSASESVLDSDSQSEPDSGSDSATEFDSASDSQPVSQERLLQPPLLPASVFVCLAQHARE